MVLNGPPSSTSALAPTVKWPSPVLLPLLLSHPQLEEWEGGSKVGLFRLQGGTETSSHNSFFFSTPERKAGLGLLMFALIPELSADAFPPFCAYSFCLPLAFICSRVCPPSAAWEILKHYGEKEQYESCPLSLPERGDGRRPPSVHLLTRKTIRLSSCGKVC